MRTLKLFLFLIVCALSESFIIECEFFDFPVINGYTCDVTNITIMEPKDLIVTKVEGQHERFKNNHDVKTFKSFGKIKVFPRNLTKFFTNIKNLIIIDSNIKSISKTDLKEFGKIPKL